VPAALCQRCAGELVVEQLLHRYGKKRSSWPKKLLKTLEKRNATLTAAISERVGFVPKELFWPLGNAAHDVFTGKEGQQHCSHIINQAVGAVWPALLIVNELHVLPRATVVISSLCLQELHCARGSLIVLQPACMLLVMAA
jgi:hypothetical protein